MKSLKSLKVWKGLLSREIGAVKAISDVASDTDKMLQVIARERYFIKLYVGNTMFDSETLA